VLKLPKNRAVYSVTTNKIVSKFKLNDINTTDLTNGIIVFENCKIPLDLKSIKSVLRSKFIKRFPTIKVKDIKLYSPSSLEPNLALYSFVKLKISDNVLTRAKGSFEIVLKRGKSIKKKYLKFKIDATILLFKANYNLRNGKILQNSDYQKVRVDFSKLPSGAIVKELKKSYIIKGYIRKGSILRQNNLRIKKDILKGSYIKAVLQDENLILEIDAHLLKDANVGDIVKIRTSSGKIFRVKILSQKVARILE